MFGAKTPFGGGGFGSNTSAFGTQQTTPFGSTSGGLFGSKTPAAGAFGTPSFGSTTPASGSLFGGTSTGTSLFGNKTTQASTGFGFGTTGTSSSSIFGGGGSSLFQTPQTSNAFGAKGFGGFGGTTGTGFGTSTSSSLFGGGATSSGFGQQQATSGTTVKFAAVTGTEQTQKSGVSMTVKTQNQCITVMDAYKDKSVEELRLEDYNAGRKGSSTATFGATGSSSLFGSTANTGSSLFGNTATSKPAGFGFGTSTSSGGLFGQSSGGLFGAKTTSSLFGATTTTTQSGFGGFGTSSGGGLFGGTSNAGTSLFGNTSTQQSSLFGSSGFGSNTQTSTGGLFGGTSAFGQPATQTTSLFGNTAKPAFGGFGTSTGSGFGTNNTFSLGGAASSGGGGLFGSAAKPALSFGTGTTGFGTSTSGFGGFGNTATSTGGLFGNTSSGSLFGNKTSGFGTTGFGSTASNTGGSLFGGTTSGFGTGTTGFGGFGVAQNTGLSMGNASLGGLSNLDQSTLAALRQQQIMQQQLKAIANTPFGDSPLFRNLTDSNKSKSNQSSTDSSIKEPMNTSQYKVLSRPAARVKPRPISSPSLGKSRLFDGLEDEGDFSPHSLQPRRSVKKLIIRNKLHDDISPSEEVQFKFRSTIDADDDLVAPSPEVIKTKDATMQSQSSDRTKSMFDNTISELNARENSPVTKRTQNYVITPLSKSIDEERASEVEIDHDEIYELPLCKIILRKPEYYTRPSIDALDKQVVDEQCMVRDFTVGRQGYGEVKFLGITDVYNLNLDKIVFFRRREVEVYPDDYPNKPEVGKELNKPSEITLLKVWPNDKSSHTPVKTPDRLKASGFIERIEEKTMAMDAVFIDYRPKEGAWVFKVNHFTRYGIQDEDYISEAIDFEKRKRILKEKIMQQQDIDFHKESPLTSDEIKMKLKKKIELQTFQDDEEEEISMVTNEAYVSEDSQMEDEDDEEIDISTQQTDNLEVDKEDNFLPLSHQLNRIARVQPFHLQGMKNSIMYEDEEEVATPTTKLRSKQLFSNKSIFNASYMDVDKKQSQFQKLDTSKLILHPQENLNSSLFQNVMQDDLTDSAKRKAQKTSHLFKTGLFAQQSFIEDETPKAVPAEDMINENLFIKCRSYGLVPYEQSLLFAKLSLLSDAGLMHSRRFNIQWSNKSTFVHAGQRLGLINELTQKQTPSIFSSNMGQLSSTLALKNNCVHIESVRQNTNEGVNQYIKDCLEISLKHSEFQPCMNGSLNLITMNTGVQSIIDYADKAKSFSDAAVNTDLSIFQNQAFVWQLVSALWGQKDIDVTGNLYEVHSARRDAFSKWLSNSVAEEVKKEVEANRIVDDGHLSVIFSLLSGNQVTAACKTARENKETRLAFLLSQISGDYHLKHYIRNQLNQWEESSVDAYINAARLKLYTLLSGMMVWKSPNHYVNLCDNLNWKRCLALHFWHCCSSTATIFDAFNEYQNAYKGTDSYDSYAAQPSPEYLKENDNNIKDLSYHLLALYCKRSHSLEKMFTPKTHTANPLDHHLSWHLHQVLDQLGYNHMNVERHTFLQHNYAAQLENIGLWEWAIYVLMHIKDDNQREYYVKDMLSRYCYSNQDNSADMVDKEDYLVNKFNVPVQWLHEAKALHAKYLGEHSSEAYHLIRAGHWDKAHVGILEHLAANAIIEESYETLKDLLQDISLPERCCTVKNWRIGGQVYFDYILLNEKLESIKMNKSQMTSYHLEDMEAEIASLINRISLMKVTSSRERLSQSEMAKNCSNMLKIVFSLLNSDDDFCEDDTPKWSSMKVVPYVIDLPLPPDYYMKELRELLANFANEIENPEGT